MSFAKEVRRGWRIAAIVEGGVLGLVLAVLLLGSLLDDSTEHPLDRSDAPEADASVTLFEVGRPFLFGSSTVRAYYHAKSVTVPVFLEAEIYNDGASLSPWNWRITWEGATAVLTLRGEEQAEQTYRLSAVGAETPEA